MSHIYWDPNPELFRVPLLDWPVLWYGVLFASGFALGFPIFVNVLNRFLGTNQKKKAIQIADQLTIYVILGTVIGARLGHFLFYEKPADYLRNPFEVFKIWEGGLASHGGALGIILAIWFFSLKKLAPALTWVRLLDFLSIPAALAAVFIRIANFINQEILGTPTDLPWAVVFGHPADRSSPIPRHPVQIYEALFYFLIFLILFRLSHRSWFLRSQGKLIGIFLVLVFGFRFFIEFLKTEQSRLIEASNLTMGQILSLPLIVLGIFLYCKWPIDPISFSKR